MNTLWDKQINNKIKQHGHVLGMDEYRIRKKVLKIKIRVKNQQVRPRSRWERVKEDIMQKGGRSLEDTEKEELCKDRGRWQELIVWWPTNKWKCFWGGGWSQKGKSWAWSKDCTDVGTVSSVWEVHVAFIFSTVGEFVCIYSLCEYISNISWFHWMDSLSYLNNIMAKCTSQHVRVCKYNTSSHHTLTEHKHGFKVKPVPQFTVSVGMGKRSSLPVDHNKNVYAWWNFLNSKINSSTLHKYIILYVCNTQGTY